MQKPCNFVAEIKKQHKKHIVYYEKKLIRLGIVLHIRGKVWC